MLLTWLIGAVVCTLNTQVRWGDSYDKLQSRFVLVLAPEGRTVRRTGLKVVPYVERDRIPNQKTDPPPCMLRDSPTHFHPGRCGTSAHTWGDEQNSGQRPVSEKATRSMFSSSHTSTTSNTFTCRPRCMLICAHFIMVLLRTHVAYVRKVLRLVHNTYRAPGYV